MNKYFRIVYYTDGEDYETHEKLVDEPTFRSIQKIMASGGGNVMFENGMIRTSAIKEIMPADDIVREYTNLGIGLKQIGLKELPKLGEAQEKEKLSEGRLKFEEMKNKSGFGKQMIDDKTRTDILEQDAKESRKL